MGTGEDFSGEGGPGVVIGVRERATTIIGEIVNAAVRGTVQNQAVDVAVNVETVGNRYRSWFRSWHW